MRALAIALLPTFVGCVGLSIEQIRSGVVGLGSAEIASCMGPPDRLVPVHEGQVWLFARPLASVAQHVEIQADVEGAPTHGRRGPTVIYGDVTRRDTAELREADPELAPGLCLLRFELREGRVADVQARGLTHAGLNSDTECARLAQTCLEGGRGGSR